RNLRRPSRIAKLCRRPRWCSPPVRGHGNHGRAQQRCRHPAAARRGGHHHSVDARRDSAGQLAEADKPTFPAYVSTLPARVIWLMRPLGEYKWQDWRRLRPVTHWLKTRQYQAQREAYVRRPARTDIATLPSIGGRRLLVTIAFEDPEAIDLQAQLVARF